MAAPQRTRGIRPVGNDVPLSLKPLLTDIRDAVQQLNGDGEFGALRRAQFLEALRRNIGRVALPPRHGDDDPGDISVITDPYFQDLKKQTQQALSDLAALFAFNTASEVLVRQNQDYVARVEADVQEQADDLAAQALELAQQAQDLLNLATDLDAVEAELHDPVTGLDAQATLLTATVVRVDNAEDSIDALTAQVTSLESEIVDVAALDPGIMWQFESSADGWTSNATLTQNAAHIRIAAAANTHFTSPTGLAINGALFPRVVARIRRVSGTGWLGRLTYATTGSGSHGLDPVNYHLTLASAPNFSGGGWVIVTWDMELLTTGGNDWVTHVIDQIRLEPSNDASTVYDVDWIALARIAPSYVTSTVNSLESRVTQAENDIDALSAAVTSLDTRADDLEGDVSANTSAISALTTRITTAENEIDVNSASIVTLDSRLDAAEGTITGHATAISGLQTSVTSINGTLSSHTSQLTSLDARLDILEPDVSGHASAISSLQASVTSINGTLSSHSGQLVSLDARLDAAEGTLAANASAISSLDARVDSAELEITSQALSLTSLDARLDQAELNISGQATAVSNLSARVTATENGVESSAAAVTMLQVYGRDANRINPLTIPGNATDWDFASSDVVPINIGSRNTVAGRIRTSTSVQRVSKWVEIDPRGIYEVRMSVLKNRAHGYLYMGMYASTDGVSANAGANAVWNRAVQGGVQTNLYWAYQGATEADHLLFTPNFWYDFVFYILGSDAFPNMCPAARRNDVAMSDQTSFAWVTDGWRLQPGARFALLRVLNYYNGTSTDAYFNNFSITRLDNQRTAAIVEEAAARATADGTLSAERTIKIQVNGYVTGYGLAVVSGVSGPVQSSFNVLADRFNFAMPGVVGPTPVFSVGNVNGTPTFGLNGNLIVDGTIVTRHLIAEGVTTPKLSQNAVTANVFTQPVETQFFTGNGVYTTLATLAVTVTDMANIQLMWALIIEHLTNSNPQGLRWDLRRDGVSIHNNVLSTSNVANWFGMIVSRQARFYMDFRSPGQYVYTIGATFPSGSGSWSVQDKQLSATVFKR